MPFADYFRASVVEPLGLTGALHGSAAWGYRGPLDDLLKLGRELLAPRHVHRESHLGEVVARAQDVAPSHRGVRHREHPREKDVEAVARIAFANNRRSRCDLVAFHPLCELHQGLAGKTGEELDAGKLML